MPLKWEYQNVQLAGMASVRYSCWKRSWPAPRTNRC